MTAKTYGGAVRSSVRMLSYPRVLTTVGKKFVTEAEETIESNKMVRTQVFISSKASFSPLKKVCDSASFQSSSPMSSCRR